MSDSRKRAVSCDGQSHPIEILSITQAGPVWVRLLGPTRQLGTHKVHKGPSVICWGQPACGATHKLPYRSKWYAAAIFYVESQQVWHRTVVEVTEALEPKLRGRSLRGEEWCLYRACVPGRMNELCGQLTAHIDLAKLPDPHEVEPTLCRVYGVTELPEPTRALKPPRPMAEPIQGDRPLGLVAAADFFEQEAKPATPEEVHKIMQRARARLGGVPSRNGH